MREGEVSMGLSEDIERVALQERELVLPRLDAQTAWELGARNAYLQVNVENEPARRLYREFGFAERYQYWYRGRPGEQE